MDTALYDRHHRTDRDSWCSLNWVLYSVKVKVKAIKVTLIKSGLVVLSMDINLINMC